MRIYTGEIVLSCRVGDGGCPWCYRSMECDYACVHLHTIDAVSLWITSVFHDLHDEVASGASAISSSLLASGSKCAHAVSAEGPTPCWSQWV